MNYTMPPGFDPSNVPAWPSLIAPAILILGFSFAWWKFVKNERRKVFNKQERQLQRDGWSPML